MRRSSILKQAALAEFLAFACLVFGGSRATIVITKKRQLRCFAKQYQQSAL